MESWVFIAVAAAAFQTLRFMLQKQLSMGTLSTGGSTFSRFFYSVPFICTLAIGYALIKGHGVPDLSGMFWLYAIIGGLSQILATWCVVALFQQRNFAVGITFKKTEVLLTAFVGLIILGDTISLTGFIAIFLGLLGVLALSQKPGNVHGSFLSGIVNAGSGLGILSGIFFAFSAVGYRGATLEILNADPLYRSSMSLMLVTIGQTLGMMVWLKLREPGEILRVVAARKTAVWMGITGMAGSLCWFTAFTLQNAAYVFAVGQIEVIFSLVASALFFREVITRKEITGIALITISILCLVVFG
ncbi:DMT family transporter [Cohaesibacter gelatinilyticus]|uniref:EamA-like transporter family protein n=1 Tax=Cohaesibacter gelatinilyticus TaxID=372072 RepID=A0A285PH21_9HYPH|nr:DMT family transporter [Cohaesibacter gelatinilyticus]SNZ19436.1 EamA-like transporter family protein [Cohaesibacter gelatinilyticus]